MQGDTGDLGDSDEGEEEVDSGEPLDAMSSMSVLYILFYGDWGFFFLLNKFLYSQHILGGDDEAPTRPDQTSAHQREVLGKGQLVSGPGEVGNTCQDESPLLKHQESASYSPTGIIPIHSNYIYIYIYI